jgi:hypothetical protein
VWRASGSSRSHLLSAYDAIHLITGSAGLSCGTAISVKLKGIRSFPARTSPPAPIPAGALQPGTGAADDTAVAGRDAPYLSGGMVLCPCRPRAGGGSRCVAGKTRS